MATRSLSVSALCTCIRGSLLLLFAATPALAGLSVTIDQPTARQKFVLGDSMTVQGTVSYPEKKEKEEEATITWKFSVEGRQRTAATSSGESGSIDLGFPFPASNQAFGEVSVSATVNKRDVKSDGDTSGDALNETIIEQDGESHEGYIVNNPDSDAQDMVIAEDTSEKEGCTYLIQGFCTEANKSGPRRGDTFGQPWTSDDPAHWAYWVRKAVIEGNRRGLNEDDLQHAIWGITNGHRWNDEFLDGIGYPEDGPTRVVDELPPHPPSGFTARAGNGCIALAWNHAEESDLVQTVIVYRTDGRYPANVHDGIFLTGIGGAPGAPERFIHQPLVNGTAVHYAAFSTDENSDRPSSAVLATAIPSPTADVNPPGPIVNFSGTAGRDSVSLAWSNPASTDLAQVRVVMREDGRYPRHPGDGSVLVAAAAAPGAAGQRLVQGLKPGWPCHFAAFALDAKGNVSERSVCRVVPTTDRGNVEIEVMPPWARWMVVDGVGRQHRGTGSARLSVPAGRVTVHWIDVDGYDVVKRSDSADLAPGGTARFATFLEYASAPTFGNPANILNTLLGKTPADPDMDRNNDQRVDIADLVRAFALNRPLTPSNPKPADGTTGVYYYTQIEWSGGYSITDPNAERYDLYLWKSGEARPAKPAYPLLEGPYYVVIGLQPSTKYNWQAVARNSHCQVEGPVWSFTTSPAPVYGLEQYLSIPGIDRY